jgi:hypothetical protein
MKRLLPVLVILAGCARAPDAATDPCARASASGDGIVLVEAWIRPVAAGGTAALYAHICNRGSADALVGAATTAAAAAELHVSERSVDGVSTMRPIDRLDIPAGGHAALAPGGAHLMLIDLAEPLSEGSTVPVSLQFERAGVVDATAEVRSGAASHAH